MKPFQVHSLACRRRAYWPSNADADTLEVISLTLSAVTGALHVTDGRATLELFVSNGGLLHAGTANGLEPAGVRGAWVVRRRVARLVLVAVGTVTDPQPVQTAP